MGGGRPKSLGTKVGENFKMFKIIGDLREIFTRFAAQKIWAATMSAPSIFCTPPQDFQFARKLLVSRAKVLHAAIIF
jgi:hypothetical protein